MSVQGRKYLANTVLLEAGLSLAFSEWIMKTVGVIDFRVDYENCRGDRF